MSNKEESNLRSEKNNVYSGKKENNFKAIVIRDFNQEPLTFREKKHKIIKELENSKNPLVSSSVKNVKAYTTEEVMLYALRYIPQNDWDIIYKIISSPLFKNEKRRGKYVSFITVPMQS